MSVGTGTITSVGPSLTGAGTSFTSELAIGNSVAGDVNGETLTIVSIEGDLDLTLSAWGPTNEFAAEGFTYAV